MPVNLTKSTPVSTTNVDLLHPDHIIGMLFASLEVGLEGCPDFEHLPADEAVLAEGTFHGLNGSHTRAVKIEGKVYHVCISPAD